MNKAALFLIIGIIFTTFGCKNSNKHLVNKYVSIDTLYYQGHEDSLCSRYISKISYVPLSQSESHIMPEATKVEICKGRIFVSCKSLHKIAVYLLNGKFLYEINCLGRGRHEYSEIANFTVDEKYVYIIDNIRHQITKYSLNDGKYIDRVNINFVAWDIEKLNKDEFLFTFLPNNPHGRIDMKQPRGSVWKTDSTFANIIEEYLPYPDNYYEMIGKNVYFTKSHGGVVFQSFQNSGYFLFSSKQESLKYTHVILPHPATSSMTSYKDVVSNGYTYLASTPYITENYIAFAVGKGNYDEPVLFCKKTNKFEMNQESDSKNAFLSPSCVNGNSFVTYLSDNYLYQELVKDGFQKASRQTEEVLKKGGACLIVYTMKQP